jgi:IS1 family transposase
MRPFVLKKADKRRLWTAIRRRTRQIAAYALGDRSEASRSIPESHRTCRAFSDFWNACSAALPASTHSGVGKKTGQDCHAERWSDTCRQSTARYARKILSFSKNDSHHELVARLLIVRYNLWRKSSFAT